MKKLIKIMVPLVLAAVLVLSMAGVAFATTYTQNLTFKGEVVDADGKPVEGAAVKLEVGSASGSTTTDADGKYSITLTCDVDDSDITMIAGEVKKAGYKISGISTGFGYNPDAMDVSIMPVTLEEEKFTLTVEGGSGSGKYAAGTQVTIAADPAPEGSQFWLWSQIDGTEGSFGNQGSATTTFDMPAGNASIEVLTKAIPVDPTDTPSDTPTTAPTDAPADTPTDNAAPTDAPTDNTKSPKTGGEADTALFLTLMGIAAAGIAVSAAALRKHAKSNR